MSFKKKQGTRVLFLSIFLIGSKNEKLFIKNITCFFFFFFFFFDIWEDITFPKIKKLLIILFFFIYKIF